MKVKKLRSPDGRRNTRPDANELLSHIISIETQALVNPMCRHS